MAAHWYARDCETEKIIAQSDSFERCYQAARAKYPEKIGIGPAKFYLSTWGDQEEKQRGVTTMDKLEMATIALVALLVILIYSIKHPVT